MATLALDDTLLVAYADNELDSVTASLVAEQVGTDPELAARVAMFKQTGAMLKAALSTPDQLEVPAGLRASIVTQIARHRSPRRLFSRSPSRSPWAWGSLAAAAAIAGYIVGASDIIQHLPFGGAQKMAVAQVMREVEEYHGIYTVEREHLVEVPASRKAHLEAWLGGRLNKPFQVPDLTSYELEFQGGRLLSVGRQPVAQLMYTGKDGVPVALCIALTAGDASSPLQSHDDAGTTVYGFGDGQYVYIVAGPSKNPALRAVAESMPRLLQRS